MEKGLLEEEEEAGVTLVNLMGVAAVVVAVLATERPRVEFGMTVTTFVSSVNRGARSDLATVEKERHAPNGSPKPKCPFRLCI